MYKIPTYNGLDILDPHFPVCESDTCVHRKSCANHITAGDFRTDSGDSPKLLQRKDGYYCTQTFSDRIFGALGFSKNREAISFSEYLHSN